MIYIAMCDYAGFNRPDPWFDEEKMTWQSFYSECEEWEEDVAARRIDMLKEFGPSSEVADAVISMPTSETERLLYDQAVACGVVFTEEELEEMGNPNIPDDVKERQFMEEIKALQCPEDRKSGNVDWVQEVRYLQRC